MPTPIPIASSATAAQRAFSRRTHHSGNRGHAGTPTAPASRGISATAWTLGFERCGTSTRYARHQGLTRHPTVTTAPR